MAVVQDCLCEADSGMVVRFAQSFEFIKHVPAAQMYGTVGQCNAIVEGFRPQLEAADDSKWRLGGVK